MARSKDSALESIAGWKVWEDAATPAGTTPGNDGSSPTNGPGSGDAPGPQAVPQVGALTCPSCGYTGQMNAPKSATMDLPAGVGGGGDPGYAAAE